MTKTNLITGSTDDIDLLVAKNWLEKVRRFYCMAATSRISWSQKKKSAKTQ
ncbi:hypothetical protein [Pseudovibrio japonicus]|uniref:hypothetical protein n=1 Tax=Pseudovibrio japonicus TaxID=366534 RepID=UPI001AD94A49|nr:hypothetical protein [Pseudovibrio japonicus]